jgi:uncharacterized glyoxalase superfamily protein PhnB
MTTSQAKPIPHGMHTVTPQLTCAGAAEAIAFYKKAFDAVEMMRLPGKDVGDRYGQLEEPFGHRWSVATHIRDMSAEEMQQAMQKMGG